MLLAAAQKECLPPPLCRCPETCHTCCSRRQTGRVCLCAALDRPALRWAQLLLSILGTALDALRGWGLRMLKGSRLLRVALHLFRFCKLRTPGRAPAPSAMQAVLSSGFGPLSQPTPMCTVPSCTVVTQPVVATLRIEGSGGQPEAWAGPAGKAVCPCCSTDLRNEAGC